jgi:hypothetical protein
MTAFDGRLSPGAVTLRGSLASDLMTALTGRLSIISVITRPADDTYTYDPAADGDYEPPGDGSHSAR